MHEHPFWKQVPNGYLSLLYPSLLQVTFSSDSSTRLFGFDGVDLSCGCTGCTISCRIGVRYWGCLRSISLQDGIANIASQKSCCVVSKLLLSLECLPTGWWFQTFLNSIIDWSLGVHQCVTHHDMAKSNKITDKHKNTTLFSSQTSPICLFGPLPP